MARRAGGGMFACMKLLLIGSALLGLLLAVASCGDDIQDRSPDFDESRLRPPQGPAELTIGKGVIRPEHQVIVRGSPARWLWADDSNDIAYLGAIDCGSDIVAFPRESAVQEVFLEDEGTFVLVPFRTVEGVPDCQQLLDKAHLGATLTSTSAPLDYYTY
jgi:hypothetical protein